METPLLDAALIVKNEEHYLPGCLAALAALRPLLHEICVYDTGSTDATVEIAEAAGARVERGYWDGDFSRARNASLAMTTAKWVLIVDADEIVRADVPALRRELRGALTRDLIGYDDLLVSVENVGAGNVPQMTNQSRRLLRTSRARYANAVHEDVVHVRPGRSLRETTLSPSTVRFTHLGYVDDETVLAKTARNERIADDAVAALEGRPNQVEDLIRALVDRARSAHWQGRAESALRDFERVRSMRSRRTYRTWGMEMLADLYIDLRMTAQADDVIAQLRREGVAHPEYCDWLEARLLLTTGRTEDGMAIVRRLDVLRTSGGVTSAPYLLLEARQEGAMALGAHDEAAVCLIRLMAGQGRIRPRSGELLLTLWGRLPRAALLELLIEADRGHLPAVIAEFDRFEEGHELAAGLRTALSAKETGDPLPAGSSIGTVVRPETREKSSVTPAGDR